MARLKKQKSRSQQVTDLAIDYLKLKTAAKATKGAGRGAKKGGTAVYKAAKKTPLVKRIPIVLAGAGATFAAVKVFKGRDSDSAAAA